MAVVSLSFWLIFLSFIFSTFIHSFIPSILFINIHPISCTPCCVIFNHIFFLFDPFFDVFLRSLPVNIPCFCNSICFITAFTFVPLGPVTWIARDRPVTSYSISYSTISPGNKLRKYFSSNEAPELPPPLLLLPPPPPPSV